jgi:hypothetical protein
VKLFIFLDDADTTSPRIVLHVNGNHLFMSPAEALKVRSELDWALESLVKIQKHNIKEKYRESL